MAGEGSGVARHVSKPACAVGAAMRAVHQCARESSAITDAVQVMHHRVCVYASRATMCMV